MPWLDEGGQPVSDTTLLQTLGTPPAAPAAGAGMWKDESGNPVTDPSLLQSLGSPRGMGGETGGRSNPAPFSIPMPSATAGAWSAFTGGLKSAIPSMGQGVIDSLVAGGQGTSPDVANGGYVKAAPGAQAMFDETGKLPDEQNMAALRDPDSGKYAVYYRNPDAAEGRMTSAARAITSGLVAGGPPGTGAAISGAISPILNGAKTAGNIAGIGSGETKALSKIAGAVAASEKGGGPGALDMTGQLVGGTGKQPLALVDVGGPEVQNLYGQAARVPGPGRTAATKFLENRDAGAGTRLTADVNEALGGDKTAFQTAADLTDAQKAAAAPAYEKAFSQPAWSPRLQEFLDQPEMKAGLNQGMKMERLDAVSEGRPFDPTAMGVDIDGEGNVKILATPNTRVLDAGKRGLDAMIAAERNDVTGKMSPLGRSYSIFREKYLGEMDKLNPDYATARAAFSGPASSMDAMKLGAGIFKMEPEEIAQAVSKLEPSNRQFMRLGVESALRKTIAQTGPAGDEARALLKNNYVQQQLRPIFGSQADFDKVINAAKNESLMAKTKYNIMGNSMTQARAVQDASGGGSLLRPIAEAGAAFGTGEPILGAKAAYGFLQALKARATGMTPSVAEQIVNLLGDPSMSGDINRALAALAGPRRLQVPQGLLQPAPSVTAAGGLLGGPGTNQR